MSASTPTSTLPGAPAEAEVDVSCRVPLFVLFTGAAVWIALASAFDLMASIKFHSPNFLADCAWLTYGRVHAAAVNALLYGFALQAGLGVALRIFAQLGRTRVFQPWLIAVGGKIWNLGVLVGVIAILAGDSTGFENLEMPRYAAVLLFLGYLLIGVWTVLTLRHRHQTGLSAPQWFLLAALFWLPWIYSTANLLLLIFPVRGVEQAVINWWYSGNLTVVWLSLVGLATFFYFFKKGSGPVPDSRDAELGAQSEDEPGVNLVGRGTPCAPSGGGQGTARPTLRLIEKDYRPLFTFWTLILFGSWVGIPSSAPVPAWIPTLSTIATALLVIPLLTVAVIVYGTPTPPLSHPPSAVRLRRTGRMGEGGLRSGEGRLLARGDPSLRFIQFGIAAWLIAGGMKIAATLPEVSPYTNFTWFMVAQSQLNAYGFFAMTMFGAIYQMVPQVAGVEWPLPKAVRAHFWCAAVGILLSVLPLAIGGLAQGIKLNNPQIAFMELTKATLPFLRFSTLGSALIFLSNLLLVINLLGLSVRYSWTHFVPVYKSVTAESQSAEVKS